MSFRYDDVVIEVLDGDITEMMVDAIVNPANSYLLMGGGVAGAIKRKGGVEIEKEARKMAPIEIGQAIVTPAGNLPTKWIIHAPTVKRPAGKASLESVSLATRAALRIAERIGARSLAFPIMGTGVGGLSIAKAAKTMLNEITSHINHGTNLRKIVLVAWGEKAFADLFSVAKGLLKSYATK